MSEDIDKLQQRLEAMLSAGKSAEEVAAELGGFVVDLSAASDDDAAKQAERLRDYMGRAQ